MDLKTFKILFSNSKSSLLLGFYFLFYFLFERCTTLGNNPVIVARYLQYRAETSFKLKFSSKRKDILNKRNEVIKVMSEYTSCFILLQ